MAFAKRAASTLDAAFLIDSFKLYLRSCNKSPNTITVYTTSVRKLAEFLQSRELPLEPAKITKRHVESYISHEIETHSPGNAAVRFRSLQQYFKWLKLDEEIDKDPMATMRVPQAPVKPPPVLSDQEIRALLAACTGPKFVERRDLAIIRLLLDTGMRRGELAGIKIDDIDFDRQEITITGKGSRTRIVHFGTKAARDLDRYLRARAQHPQAELPWVWLGHAGRLTDNGIYQALQSRAKQAGVEVWTHLFRHTFAHLWLANEGQEGDLMQLAGWRSHSMLARYGASMASARARKAHVKNSPGDRY